MEALPLRALPADARAQLMQGSQRPFQSPHYLDALAAAGAEVVALADPTLGHAWALEHETMGFRTWVSPCEPALATGAAPEALFGAILEAARARGALAIAWREAALVRMPEAMLLGAAEAAKARGAEAVPGQMATREVPLGDETALWEGLDRRHRNAARKAQRAGVRVERVDADRFLDAYAAMSDATFARSGMPGPSRAYLERAVALPWTRCYRATDAQGGMVAGAIVAVEPRGATYLHGAGTRAVDGAGELLQWETMRDLAASGVPAYDLGGIALPGSPGDTPKAAGIRRFKERFGGALALWPSLQLRVDPAAYREAQQRVRGAR